MTSAAYDAEDLLATYRELHFGLRLENPTDPQKVRAAAKVLLDAVDVAGSFYQEMALGISGFHPKRLLDAGCGMGRLSGELAALSTHLDYVGLDLSLSMVREGRPMFGLRRNSDSDEPTIETAEFLAGDATCLPFTDGAFDFVVAANLVDRVSEPNSVILELWRVLCPGGYLYLSDPFHWETTPDERFYNFDHVAALLPDSIAVDYSPKRSIFCVRRRDGDRVVTYLNHNAVFRRKVVSPAEG